MNIENAKSQMRKGMLEYCVLLLLKHSPFTDEEGHAGVLRTAALEA